MELIEKINNNKIRFEFAPYDVIDNVIDAFGEYLTSLRYDFADFDETDDIKFEFKYDNLMDWITDIDEVKHFCAIVKRWHSCPIKCVVTEYKYEQHYTNLMELEKALEPFTDTFGDNPCQYTLEL